MKVISLNHEKGTIRQYLVKKLPLIMAFLIPVLILLILYIGREVFPFGENMYLRSDMYHQYAPFTREFQRNLQNGGSLLYSWNIGLGNNFASTYAYYLASPVNWLLSIFPDTLVPEFMNLMLILKSGLMSSIFAWYLIRKFRRNGYIATVFGCFYAMSAYMAAFSWNVMWLDCLVLFPLILHGLEALVKQGRVRMYVICLAVCIISNYYISIMICFFLVFYFIYLIICERNGGKGFDIIVPCCQFILYSVMAGCMAMFIVLPALFNLFITASSESAFPYSMLAYYNVLEMLSKAVINTEPAVFSGHFPNIYCGMAVFVLIPMYWISRRVPVRERIGKTLLISLLAFSFMFNIPTYIWHGFHFPNSLPCRYSFIYIFMVLVMGYEAMISVRRFRFKEIVLCSAAGLAGVFILQKLYESSLTLGNAFLGAFFILLYLLSLVLMKIRRVPKAVVMILLMITVIAELIINTNETGYSTTSRTVYMSDNSAIRNLLWQVDDGTFYRVEKVNRRTKNDGTWNDYNSVSVFSSTTVSANSDLFSSLGMQGRTNAYSYSGHTPFTQALLGVRYEITDREQTDPLMTQVASRGAFRLYENRYALSLGFMVPSTIYDSVAPVSNPFGYQNGLVNDLTGVEELYDIMESYNGEKAEFTVRKTGRCLVYLTGGADSVKVQIVRGEEQITSEDHDSIEPPQIIDIGDVEAGDKVIIVSDDPDSSIVTAYPAVMDYAEYDEAMTVLTAQQMEIQEFSDTYIRGSVNVSDRTVLMTTIPYDEGWTVYVDGVKTAFNDLEDAFILVDLTPGEHIVEFRYWPVGLTAGIIVSVVALAVFVLLEIINKRKKLA